MTKQRLAGQAGVLVVVDDHARAVLLTRRAAHMRSHGAEIALPGGKWEPNDGSLWATALRETAEEVGLPSSALRLQGALAQSVTAAGVVVQPYVAKLSPGATPRVNSAEIDALFWLPEAFLRDDQRLRTDVITLAGQEYWSPAYRFREYEIWGFTARVLVQYLARFCDCQLTQAHPAPVARHKPRC